MEPLHDHLCACTSEINVVQHTFFSPFCLAELYFHSKHQLRKKEQANKQYAAYSVIICRIQYFP